MEIESAIGCDSGRFRLICDIASILVVRSNNREI